MNRNNFKLKNLLKSEQVFNIFKVMVTLLPTKSNFSYRVVTIHIYQQ